MSELLALRREVVALRKKADRARSLETQNAMLHLSVAKCEQENITLKRAVVILQRRLQEEEVATVEKAALLSACRGRESSCAAQERRRNTSSSCGTAAADEHGLSPSIGRSSSASCARESPVLMRMRPGGSSPHRPLSTSPLRPQVVGAMQSQQVNIGRAERSTTSITAKSGSRPQTSSLLFTPPKKLLSSSTARVSGNASSTTAATSNTFKDNDASPRFLHRLVSASTSRAIVHEATSVISPSDGFDEGSGAVVEVSAISSLFSPMSARNVSVACSGGTPVSPRTVVPSPLPRSTLDVTTSNGALPSAPSRVQHAAASLRPPTAPGTTDRLQRGRPIHRTASPLSRSPSAVSSEGYASIDEELNEGIQRRLSSFTFF